MRKILRSLHKAGPYRIVEDVSNQRIHALVSPQDALVVSILPDARNVKLRARDVRDSLFRHLHKPPKVRFR